MTYLRGEITKVSTVKEKDIRFIFDTLYKDYYDGVTYEGYFRDHFKEKEYVILLKTEEGIIKGFSLQQVLQIDIEGQEVAILWAGDILVHPDYWGKNEYRLKLSELCLQLHKEYHPQKLVYRLSTPKGYKTYRVVPNLFRKFYPSPDYNFYPEFESKVIDKILSKKYPPEIYDKERKLLVVNDEDHRLAAGFAQVTEEKLKDPLIRCFYENNPDYARGNEIPVIAPIFPENIKEQKHFF
ncbi:MAG: hypothetical protein ACRBFS_05305 [Aureispira sp.]